MKPTELTTRALELARTEDGFSESSAATLRREFPKVHYRTRATSLWRARVKVKKERKNE